MTYARLKWIAKAIEYDRLQDAESSFLFSFIEKFMVGRCTKTEDEDLEKLFAGTQWREKKLNKEVALQVSATA